MGDHDVSHLTDEELVLHHFGETEDAAVRAHLAQCDACRAALEGLRRDLAAVPVPEVLLKKSSLLSVFIVPQARAMTQA